MQNAQNMVEAVFVNRQQGVLACCDGGHNCGQFIVDVDRGDFRSGHHDVVDRNGLQIQNPRQHTLALTDGCGTFGYDGLEFICGQLIGVVIEVGKKGRTKALLTTLTKATAGINTFCRFDTNTAFLMPSSRAAPRPVFWGQPLRKSGK